MFFVVLKGGKSRLGSIAFTPSAEARSSVAPAVTVEADEKLHRTADPTMPQYVLPGFTVSPPPLWSSFAQGNGSKDREPLPWWEVMTRADTTGPMVCTTTLWLQAFMSLNEGDEGQERVVIEEIGWGRTADGSFSVVCVDGIRQWPVAFCVFGNGASAR